MALQKERRRLTVSACDSVKDPTSTKDGGVWDSLLSHLETKYPGRTVCNKVSQQDRDGHRRRSFLEKDNLDKGCPQPAWLGIACKKGLKPEAPNQDSYSCLIVTDEFSLYGIFDGHGPFGHKVSDRARDILVSKFIHHEERDSNTQKAFEETFVETQKEIVAELESHAANSGTTCTMAYHDIAKRTVTLAHVGDSRGVLGLKGKDGRFMNAEALTVDHKPELPEEKKRIESCGGRVEFDGYFNYRVFAKAGQYPGLNMSRALGDSVAHKEAGLTAQPEVKVVNLSDYAQQYDRATLILCSDGVWEFIESRDCVTFLGDANLNNAANKLATESYQRWMKDSDNEVSDDITAVLVDIDLTAMK